MNQPGESDFQFDYLLRAIFATVFLLANCFDGHSQQSPAPPVQPNNPTQSPIQNPPAPSANQNPPAPNPPLASPASPGQAVTPLALDDAVRLALVQASNFQQAQLAERIASEDVRQARLAFL